MPALKAQYTPTAKRNICIVYSHGIGITAGDPQSVATIYGFMLSWLEALRADGQNWTVLIGLICAPGNAELDAFNALIVKNAAALGVSYFAELTQQQISAVAQAPNQLMNLYIWNAANARFHAHASPLAYAMQSTAWVEAINAAL